MDWYKNEIKTRLAVAHKWRPSAVQMSLGFASDNHPLEKIFKQKRHDILEEVHKLIFIDRVNHYLVFEALIEFLWENSLEENFPEIKRRDVSLLVACLEEHRGSTEFVPDLLFELKSIINQN